MLRLIKDARVFSSMGEKVGTLERVVLDPETMEVSALIVKRGVFPAQSTVIPISFVELGEKQIKLNKTVIELEKLPEYNETYYVSTGQGVKSDEEAEAVYWYPPPNVAWWVMGGRNFYPKPRYVHKTEANLPEGTVALEEGAMVVSKDGEEVGSIERVIVETSENLATHFVVCKGLLFKEYKLIPTIWISNVTDDKVYLLIGSSTLDKLIDYQPVP